MGNVSNQQGRRQNRKISIQAGERVRVKLHMSDTTRRTGRSVVCGNRRTKTANSEVRQGWIRGQSSRPIKSNVSELISGQTITMKGRLPAIQHGAFPGFIYAQA